MFKTTYSHKDKPKNETSGNFLRNTLLKIKSVLKRTLKPKLVYQYIDVWYEHGLTLYDQIIHDNKIWDLKKDGNGKVRTDEVCSMDELPSGTLVMMTRPEENARNLAEQKAKLKFRYRGNAYKQFINRETKSLMKAGRLARKP
jgi:hypothetical protein